MSAALDAAAKAISKARAFDVGGCFRPETIEQGECDPNLGICWRDLQTLREHLGE